MIARGFRPVGWVAAVGAAALCCYMLSLQVAAERSELASLERRIIRTRQDIRSLQTELGTRGRLQQLEQWNAEVLALSAPVADQFLESNVSLARFDTGQPSFEDHARLRMASADRATSRPAPPAQLPQAAPRPALRLVSAPASAAVGSASPAPRQPLIRRASLEIAPAPARSSNVAREAPASTRPSTRSPSRPTATAEMAPTGLLDESTLRDLGAQARTERGGARN